MRRPLVVLVLLALLAPAAELALAAKGESSPTRAARIHYRNIALGEFKTAYALFTPAAKKQYGPYARWKAGYADTGQVGITGLKRSGGAVTFSLTACRGDRDREVTIEERFTARWPVRKIDGRWYLDRGAKLTRTSKRETTSCRLPLP